MLSDAAIKEIENALCINLYDWQKEVLKNNSSYIPQGRAVGKTTVYMLPSLLDYKHFEKPIEINLQSFRNPRHYVWYRNELKAMRGKLINKGIPCRAIRAGG